MAQPSQIKKSPYSAKPSQLGSPVPSTRPEATQDMAALYNSMKIDAAAAAPAPAEEASAPQPAPASPQSEYQDLYSQLSADNFRDPNLPPANGPEEITTWERVKAGFAANDQEKDAYLRKMYGPENVYHGSDGWRVKVKGKWEPFNKEVLGIGDPANLGRQAAVEVGALPAEIAGLAAAPETGGMSLVAGRVAGGIMGEELARGIAHGLIGIPIVEKTTGDMIINRALGDINQGMMRAVVGHAFDWGAKTFANKVAGKAMKGLDEGTRAAIEAVETLSAPMRAKVEGSLDMMKKNDPLRFVTNEQKGIAAVKDAVELNQAAKESGIYLRPDELFPNEPALQETAKRAMSSPKMQNFVLQRGQQAVEAVERLDNSFGVSQKNASEVIKEGNLLDRAWGRLIGDFRDEAIKKSSGQKLEMTNLSNAVGALREKLGLNGQELSREQIVRISDDLNIPTPKLMRLMSRVKEISKELESGQMDLGRVSAHYKKLQGVVDNHFDPKSPQQDQFFYALASLRDGFRDDLTDGVGRFLGAESQSAYQGALQRFSELKAAKQDVKSLFAEDSPAVSAVVDFLRSRSKSSEKIDALRTIIQQDDPMGWEVLGQTYFRRFLADHRIPGNSAEGQRIGHMDWTGVLRSLDSDKGAKEQMMKIIGPERTNSLVSLAKTMAAVQEKSVDFREPPGMIMSLINLAGQTMRGQMRAGMSDVAEAWASSRNAMRLVNSDKAAELIQKHPLATRTAFARVRELANQRTEALQRHASGLIAQDLDRMVSSALNPVPVENQPKDAR